MTMQHATGHVRTLPRKDGPVFYAKLKVPRDDGTMYEPQRRLGKVWSKRSRPPAGYLTAAQAQARLEAMLVGDDPLVNIEPPRDVVTFERACDEHLRYLEFDRQRKASYVKDCRNTMRCYLLPAFGKSTPVGDIMTADIDAFRDRLLSMPRSRRTGDGEAAPLAHKTVQKVLVLLGGILARAKRKGWVTTNAAEDAEKVSVKRSEEFNVLDVEQVAAVSRAAATDQLAAMFTVGAFTGLRQGELLALRWRHVDFANRIIHVQRNLPAGTAEEDTPKSHRVRSVPLSDQAAVALDGLSRREHFTGPDALVFGTVTGGHLNDDNVRDAFYDALEGAGLGRLRTKADPIVFHDLRHTFGTLCASKGIDVVKIQTWMGHADLATTRKYMHHAPQHDDAARLTAAFTAETVPPDMPRTTDNAVQPGATTNA
jgi:integrase